ncbi:type IV CRISPR-associated DEAD/DEAH-box helicase Csf4 (plasmid) [Burkholderia aenigmatica]|uniref:type IV CRISPR-associated DEAD/DEAH-box helicase Csf4 n=1 Tax=Burkholderia aenigmatica TaxID=2015348 RepID=UPI003B43768B
MSLNMTLAIPDGWLSAAIPEYLGMQDDEERVRGAVKSLVVDALGRGQEISQLPEEEGARRRIFISLAEPHAGVLRARASESRLGAAPFARALIGAASQHERTTRTESWDEGDPIVALNRALQVTDPQVTIRPEQIRVGGMIRNCLAEGGIGLVEAGTGVGKTRAIVASAFDWVSTRGKRAAIAAPTIALIRQFAAEAALQQRCRTDAPTVRLVFGRREFVSARALEAFLADAHARRREIADLDAVREWLAAAGKVVDHQAGIDTRWLAGSLESIAPGFPVDEVRLSDINTPDDAGYRAYRAQFLVSDEGDENEVVLCTHAMLAQDMRIRLYAAGRDEDFRAIDREIRETVKGLRDANADATAIRAQLAELDATRGSLFDSITEDRGLLPDYRALIVDEGHLLEQTFSNSLSRYVSLKACARHLREYKRSGGKLPAQSIERLDQLVTEISAVGEGVRNDFVNLSGNDPQIRRLGVLLQRVAECLEALPDPRLMTVADPTRVRSALHAQVAAATIRNATGAALSRSFLRFSPMRIYPQLYVGTGPVEPTLRAMWGRLDGAAVVSASLYLKRVSGPSAGYQRMLLAIPEQRAIEYPPVHAAWSAAPVAGLWTAGELAAALRPPTRADRLSDHAFQKAEEEWLDNLAPVIESNHASAKGGTLVLLTSYKAADGLAKRMFAANTILVHAREEYPLRRQVHDFLKLRRAGLRPIWLSVGGAWTGLDVGGHDPWTRLFDGEAISADEDNVLTDLVIPRLPFGTNQSITHLWRIQNRPGVPWDLLEAAFRFKQGLGRLVRRAGLPTNRRIFVLDGRLEDACADSAYALFRQAMSSYRVRALPAE